MLRKIKAWIDNTPLQKLEYIAMWVYGVSAAICFLDAVYIIVYCIFSH